MVAGSLASALAPVSRAISGLRVVSPMRAPITSVTVPGSRPRSVLSAARVSSRVAVARARSAWTRRSSIVARVTSKAPIEPARSRALAVATNSCDAATLVRSTSIVACAPATAKYALTTRRARSRLATSIPYSAARIDASADARDAARNPTCTNDCETIALAVCNEPMPPGTSGVNARLGCSCNGASAIPRRCARATSTRRIAATISVFDVMASAIACSSDVGMDTAAAGAMAAPGTGPATTVDIGSATSMAIATEATVTERRCRFTRASPTVSAA